MNLSIEKQYLLSFLNFIGDFYTLGLKSGLTPQKAISLVNFEYHRSFYNLEVKLEFEYRRAIFLVNFEFHCRLLCFRSKV